MHGHGGSGGGERGSEQQGQSSSSMHVGLRTGNSLRSTPRQQQPPKQQQQQLRGVQARGGSAIPSRPESRQWGNARSSSARRTPQHRPRTPLHGQAWGVSNGLPQGSQRPATSTLTTDHGRERFVAPRQVAAARPATSAGSDSGARLYSRVSTALGSSATAHPLAAGVWSRSSMRRFAKTQEPQDRVAKSLTPTHFQGNVSDGSSEATAKLRVSGRSTGPAAVAWSGDVGNGTEARHRKPMRLPEEGEEELTEQTSFILSDYMRQLVTMPVAPEANLVGAARRRWSGRDTSRVEAQQDRTRSWSAGGRRPGSASLRVQTQRAQALAAECAGGPSRDDKYGFEGSSGDEIELDVASISGSSCSSPTKMDIAMARSNISDFRPATQGGHYGSSLTSGLDGTDAPSTKEVDLSGMSANLFYAGDEGEEEEEGQGGESDIRGESIEVDADGYRRPLSRQRPPSEALFLFTNSTPARERVASKTSETRTKVAKEGRQIPLQRPGTVNPSGARERSLIRSPRKREGPIRRKAHSARPPSRQRPPPQALTLELPPDGFAHAHFDEIFKGRGSDEENDAETFS